MISPSSEDSELEEDELSLLLEPLLLAAPSSFSPVLTTLFYSVCFLLPSVVLIVPYV